MPKFSIILPIYHVEEYLEKCVSSVLNQSLQDIEVFLATDGPEACDQICQEFAARDSRVKIIYHPGSYGKGCNQGMKMASGEYIGFVETDDWCHPQMFEKLYEAAKETNADVCKGGFYDAFDDATQNVIHLFHSKNISFHISEHPELLAFQPSIWSAIYKTSFIKKNTIKMIEPRMPFIDGPFHMATLLNADIVTNVAEPLYYYYHDNPKQSVQNEEASLAGLKAEEFFYKKFPLHKVADEKLRSYIFRSTLIRLKWDYERLSNEKIKAELKTEMKIFFDSLPIYTINKEFIEDYLWLRYEFYHGKRKDFSMPPASAPKYKPKYKKWAQQIFSIKNKGNFKVVNVLGFKFKFARKGK